MATINTHKLDGGEGSKETTIKTNLRLPRGRVKTQVTEAHSKSFKGQASFGIFQNTKFKLLTCLPIFIPNLLSEPSFSFILEATLATPFHKDLVFL